MKKGSNHRVWVIGTFFLRAKLQIIDSLLIGGDNDILKTALQPKENTKNEKGA